MFRFAEYTGTRRWDRTKYTALGGSKPRRPLERSSGEVLSYGEDNWGKKSGKFWARGRPARRNRTI